MVPVSVLEIASARVSVVLSIGVAVVAPNGVKNTPWFGSVLLAPCPDM